MGLHYLIELLLLVVEEELMHVAIMVEMVED